jgi:hypothetical protein
MTWTDWNYINVFFVFVSGWMAISCFDNGNEGAGWFNLFASSLNAAIVATRLGV